MVYRKQELEPLTPDASRDRLRLCSVPVLLSASIYVMVVCSFAMGQKMPSQPPSQVPLNGFSILESHDVPSEKSAPPPSQPAPSAADAGRDVDQLLTRLVLENIPHDFEETKDWGGQTERWDGLKIQRDGLKIETRRRKKMVNDGTWNKYSAQLRNPSEEFTVQIKNMHETDDEKLAFDVHFLAHLNLEGRQAQWVKGVQLYSVGVDGHSKIRLAVSMELEVRMGGTKFPPDLVFVPRATQAQLVLDEFRIDRIGKVGGEFAQQVTKGIRAKLDEKIAEKEVKLLERINRQLAEKQDEFRISIADAVNSKWTKSARPFLPESIQRSLE